MKRFFEREVVTVRPLNGEPEYQTYLLSQIFDEENGRLQVSHVSGPTPIFPGDAEIITDNVAVERE